MSDVYHWYQGKAHGKAFLFPEKDATFGNLPVWFYLLVGITFVVFLSMTVLLASWLKGSTWINKKNPYIKGKEYVRTRAQNIVFRIVVIAIALGFLTSFFTDVLANDVLKKPLGGWDIFEGIRDYFFGLGWYYQCFLSSFLIGFALLFKKYNFMLIVWPMAFIGALRTFGDIEDLTEHMNYTSFLFYRFFFEHAMLIFMPIFIALSQRQRYTVKRLSQAILFTFFMVFVAYVLQWFIILSNSKLDKLPGWGELKGTAEWFGFDPIWPVQHIHMFFWLILVPFGLLVTTIIIFVYQFFSVKATLTEYSWGKRWVKVWGHLWLDVKVGFKNKKNSRVVHFFTTNTKYSKDKKFTMYGNKSVDKDSMQEDVYLNKIMNEYKGKGKNGKV